MFVPGLDLCGDFYRQAVAPLLDVPHTAARIGPGSEVLGFDSPRSADHDWGPRVDVFLPDLSQAAALSSKLAERLPTTFRGYPTSFEPAGARVATMAVTTGPVAHRVLFATLPSWLSSRLGFDATAGVSDADWLATPAQRLAEVVGGAVYHDPSGELTAVRERLAWYPGHVWRIVLAAQWTRIAQEEAFVGRAAEAGDDLGSRIVAARLARDVMRLCLLLARRYPPYSKWLGSAFASLPDVAPVASALRTAVGASSASVRQEALCTAYEHAGRRQNALGLTPPVDATRRLYFDRPFPVIDAGRFAAALHPAWTPGAIDSFVDSTDVLERPLLARAVSGATHRDNPEPGAGRSPRAGAGPG
ncbi:DUF4037 domain-containing protein [Actinoplanes sp. NPDC089786]|uniref:DUF4037 domain-containing protein n=1 Tax=Actinoplanes sp. NPDC089786 TaxID=3155185 RepID=UPI003415155F